MLIITVLPVCSYSGCLNTHSFWTSVPSSVEESIRHICHFQKLPRILPHWTTNTTVASQVAPPLPGASAQWDGWRSFCTQGVSHKGGYLTEVSLKTAVWIVFEYFPEIHNPANPGPSIHKRAKETKQSHGTFWSTSIFPFYLSDISRKFYPS